MVQDHLVSKQRTHMAVAASGADNRQANSNSTPATQTRNEEIRRRRALPLAERPSLRVLAKEYGVSAERIRQIEAKGGVFVRSGDDYRCRVDEGSDLILEKEGDGRYVAYHRRHRLGRSRMGLIIGGKSRWSIELAGGDSSIRGRTLRDVTLQLAVRVAASQQ